MPYLLLVLSIVVGLVLIARGVSGADPKSVKRVLKWTAIVLGVVLVVYFGFTGRLSVIGWIAAALLPLILRGRALGRMARSWRGPTPGQTSDIETAYLRMRLDHDSGELKGTVLQGRFQGRLLEELSLPELVELLQECRVHDEQAATVLETYLDRAHGAAWRGGEDARAGGGGRAGAAGGGRAGAAGGGLSRDEAYEILGLKRGASPDDIREAHRRLMQKNHPDHGGSTYIAAKINQAKDLLLG